MELCPEGDELTLHLAGEMDVLSAPLLPAVAARGVDLGVQAVRLDLSRLSFCDCAGLRAFLEARNDLLAARIGMSLRGLRPHLRKLFALTRLDEVVSIEDEIDAFRLGVVDASGTSVRSRRR